MKPTCAIAVVCLKRCSEGAALDEIEARWLAGYARVPSTRRSSDAESFGKPWAAVGKRKPPRPTNWNGDLMTQNLQTSIPQPNPAAIKNVRVPDGAGDARRCPPGIPNMRLFVGFFSGFGKTVADSRANVTTRSKSRRSELEQQEILHSAANRLSVTHRAARVPTCGPDRLPVGDDPSRAVHSSTKPPAGNLECAACPRDQQAGPAAMLLVGEETLPAQTRCTRMSTTGARRGAQAAQPAMSPTPVLWPAL